MAKYNPSTVNNVRTAIGTILNQLEKCGNEGIEFPAVRLTIDVWSKTVKVHASSAINMVDTTHDLRIATVMTGKIKFE